MKRLLYFLLALPVFMTGCSLDEDRGLTDNPPSDRGITFVLAMPDPNAGPISYGLDAAGENAVGKLDVFAFIKDTDGDYILEKHFKVGASEITTPNPVEPRRKSFKVSEFDMQEDQDYRFVVIANMTDTEISGAAAMIGEEKDEIMETLTITATNRWPLTGRNIPMWGESEEVNTETTLFEISLLRMLARIEVDVDVLPTVFKLQSVRLYNYRVGGYVVPETVASSDLDDPTVLGEPVIYEIGNSLTDPLTCEELSGFANNKCTGEFYTFETDVQKNPSTGEVSLDSVHCLVIGGTYMAGEAQKQTYYRINFIKDQTGEFMPLLRNYSYTMTVKNVKGDGYGTPDSAFYGKAFNMDADVIPWNNANDTEIIIDEVNTLTVTKGKWTFTKEERDAASDDNTIGIFTDVAEGWKVDTITYDPELAQGEEGWLELSPENGINNDNTPTNAKLILSENSTGDSRVGYIHLKAGRLIYKVEVTQLETAAPSLTVIPTYARVHNDDPDPEFGPYIKLYGSDLELMKASLDGDYTYGVTWESDDHSIAEVDANGLVTTKATTGVVTITARSKTDASITGSIKIKLTNEEYRPTSHGGWAGCNIYWDDVKKSLWFDNVGDYSHQRYQGLYFLWGSLWGLPPESNYTSATKVYKPGQTEAEAAGVPWDGPSKGDGGIPFIHDEMYLPGEYTGFIDDTRACLYEYNITADKGDICKYISILTMKNNNGVSLHGKKWRMPTRKELENNYTNPTFLPDTNWSVEIYSGSKEGKNTIDNGISKDGNYLPAAGFYDLGLIRLVGLNGYYWASSPGQQGDNNYSAGLMAFGYNNFSSSRSNRRYGQSIRCVVVDD